jgi:hypothetical protein
VPPFLAPEITASIESDTRNEPISKGKFNRRLKKWIDGNEETIGIKGDFNRVPLVFVQDGTEIFRLNRDTTRNGVIEYLKLVAKYGNDLEWRRIIGQRGKGTSVAYGPEHERVRFFYLYAIG